MVSRFTASPARNNDYSCGDLPAAECVAAGFMYKCLGCCLGSEQSALQSGCCNVCLFKVLLFGDDPSLGSIPVEVVEQQFHVTEDGKAAPGDKNDNPKPSLVPSSSSLSSSASATGDSSSLAQLLPTKIGHTEATLAAADMMITLDEKPLSPEQIKELEQKRRREKAELEQISNIQKFLRDNYKPSYLPDVEENDPSTKHTKFNLRPARTKKELADAKGVSKTAQKVYVWNGKDFDAAIIEVNGELTDHGKIVDDDNNPKPDAPEARQGTDISWTGNGKLGFPDDNDEVPEPVAAALQPVLVWTGNGKLEADLVVNPVQQRSNSRHLRFLD
ncbi:unnamed protein product [Notodromas monacha]|uniref:Uncharacterized protein n=1 Tax=Notodromas monacha TaxID=399045 RepID=A0A7R9BMX2_9CRUS|nr:unnamed protein product [Notodromas monacha]CAG0917084.1 unnamed protein product [Notodromas monacha]